MDLRTSALALAFGLGFILLLIPLYHYFDSPSISLTQVTLNSSVNLSENVSLNRINASTSAGLLIESHSGADVALFGAGGGQGTTFFDGINTNGLINGINISTRGNLSGSGTTGQVATFTTGSSTLSATTVPTCTGGQALTALGTCSSIGNVTVTSTNDRILWTPTTGSTSIVNATPYRLQDVVMQQQIVDGLAGWARKPILFAYDNNFLASGNFIYNITGYYFPWSNTSNRTTITESQMTGLFNGDLPNNALTIPANTTTVFHIRWTDRPSFVQGSTLGNWRGCWAVHSRWTANPASGYVYSQKRTQDANANYTMILQNWGSAPIASQEAGINRVIGGCDNQMPYNTNFTEIVINASNSSEFQPSEIQWFPQEGALSMQPASVNKYTLQQLFHGFFWMQRKWTGESNPLIPVAIFQDTTSPVHTGFFLLNTRTTKVFGTGSAPTFNFDVNGTSRFNRGDATSSEAYFQAGTTTGTGIGDGTSIGVDALGNGMLRNYENTNLSLYQANTERIRLTTSGHINTLPNTRLMIGSLTAPTYPLEVQQNVSGISIWTTGNISATGYLTRTEVDIRDNVLETFKDGNLLLNRNGSINHSAFGKGYTAVTVTDMSRPVFIPYYETYTEIDYNRPVYIQRGNETDVTFPYNITTQVLRHNVTYPFTKIEHQVSLSSELATIRQALAEINTAINLSNTTVDTGTILAEEIYTKSKVPEPTINYCQMIANANIYNKSQHYAYRNVNGKLLLDAEYRWVVLEGCEKQKLQELCAIDKRYSWCTK